MKKQQLIDQAVKDFRQGFCNESRTLGDKLIGWTLGECDEDDTKEVEKFLSQQIVAAYDKGREDEQLRLENHVWLCPYGSKGLHEKPDCHAEWFLREKL